jgi:Domain of unknown function (DUF4395)
MLSSTLLRFPNPVNETSARVVAGGVLAMGSASLILDQPWILFPLTYGFAARAATGPTLSPLGQLSTRVITPRLHVDHQYSPGPPKRLAQGVGLTFSATATVLHFGFGRKRAARRVITALMVAAALESVFGVCLACRAFPALTKVGLIPESVCEECATIRSKPAAV